jgi:hypothetical protein
MTRDEELRQAEAHDHARAGERGERLLRIADDITSALLGHGVLHDTRTTRRVVFHRLADWMYGNAAIDIPVEIDRP